MALFCWFLRQLYPSVWVRPILGTEDDGFESWHIAADGSLLDIRFMSEARRYREYGELFAVK